LQSRRTALALARSEIGRVFPVVTLYVRLGEFHVDGEVGPDEVLAYVVRSSPERIRPWIEDLDRNGRLVVLFDGMDEMSRDRYNEHTEALSLFAASRRGAVKTLFSCRITDFSRELNHRRLVLLPFRRTQIAEYLRRYLLVPRIEIDDQTWSLSRLARRLAAGDLPVDATNPFVLWLLCLFLQERRTWPSSRVQLLGYFLDKSYERKQEDAADEGHALPPREEALRAWAWIAWTITGRNLGAAVPVELLVAASGGGEAGERMRAMVRAGLWCGVLVASVQEAEEYLVRFEHHRFQEYFTALFIHENRPPIDWLGKLDAPRWQETMINLVLMGGAEEGVEALSRSMTSAATVPEAALADRVELGARLVRHGMRTSPAVRDLLLPRFQAAVRYWVAYGHPITQVKMLRACQNLPDLDVLTALEPLLRSPVRWVRDQALILLGAAPGEGAPRRDNLGSEMAVQLATQQLLPRWRAFVRALAAARSPRLWACFAVATLFALLDLGLPLGAAFAWLYRQSLLSPRDTALLYLLPPVAAFFALRSGRSVWRWTVLCVPLGLGAISLGLGLWQGKWDFFLPYFLVSGMMILGGIPVLALIGAVLHFGAVFLYAAATHRLRGPGPSVRSLAALSWEEGGYATVRSLGRRLRGWKPLVKPLGAGCAFAAALVLCRELGIPFDRVLPWLLGIGVAMMLGSGVLVWLQTRFKESTRAGLASLSKLAIAGGVAWGLYKGFTTWHQGIAKVFILALSLSVLSFFGWQAWKAVWRTLAARRLYRPGTFNTETWLTTLDNASPVEQEMLLRRADHRSLGMSLKEFLAVLVTAEPLVKQDPALSTYAERRDQVEQALRQERGG
jgi:hypothetical protein